MSRPKIPDRDKLRHPKKVAFLAAYANTGNVSAAARITGTPRPTHYRWMATDKDYAAAAVVALDEAADRLEAEALRRASQGWEEPVYGKLPGKDTGSGRVGTIRKYSDTLLIFLLKGARPDKYRERWQGELGAKDGNPLAFTINIAKAHADV
jgi:hypothetical protein